MIITGHNSDHLVGPRSILCLMAEEKVPLGARSEVSVGADFWKDLGDRTRKVEDVHWI